MLLIESIYTKLLTHPVLPIALALTMLIQGYVAVRVGVLRSKTFNDLGVAGVIGGVLVSRGAAMALGVGIVLCLLVFGKNFFKRKMSLYNTKSDPLFNIAALKELNAEKEGAEK